MKVIMVCSGGMSSAMVVDSIKKQADKENYDLEIKAVGSEEFENQFEKLRFRASCSTS